MARAASQGQPAQQGAALESEVTAVNGSSGTANPKLRGQSLSRAYGDSAGSSLSRRGGQGGQVWRDEKENLTKTRVTSDERT